MKIKRQNPILPSNCFYFFVVSLSIIAFSSSCSSFSSKKSIYSKRDIYISSIHENDYPNDNSIRKQIAPIKKFPELSDMSLKAILGNIEYSRTSDWGKQIRRIYAPEELEEIVSALKQCFSVIENNQRLVVISRNDPDKSVLSRMERVTLLLWADEKYLNVAFGEIHTEIPHTDFLQHNRWMDTLPISLVRSYSHLSLIPSPDFEFKKINGFIHDTWILYPIDTLNKLSYKPRTNSKNSNSGNEENAYSKKKNLLQEALEEKLISQEEYQKKLKEIQPGKKSEETPEPPSEE